MGMHATELFNVMTVLSELEPDNELLLAAMLFLRQHNLYTSMYVMN